MRLASVLLFACLVATAVASLSTFQQELYASAKVCEKYLPMWKSLGEPTKDDWKEIQAELNAQGVPISVEDIKRFFRSCEELKDILEPPKTWDEDDQLIFDIAMDSLKVQFGVNVVRSKAAVAQEYADTYVMLRKAPSQRELILARERLDLLRSEMSK